MTPELAIKLINQSVDRYISTGDREHLKDVKRILKLKKPVREHGA